MLSALPRLALKSDCAAEVSAASVLKGMLGGIFVLCEGLCAWYWLLL